MTKRDQFNLGGILFLIAAVCLMCYMLLKGNSFLPCSINSVLSSMNHCARHWHIIVVGLLPVYVALMLFGTAISSIYLGSALQRWLIQFFHQK